MKNKIALPLIIVIILGFFSSCKTKEIPNPVKVEPTPPIERVGRIDSMPESMYSLPEAPLTVPEPAVTPPPPPTVPENKPVVPEKKPATPEKKPVSKALGSYKTPLLNRNTDRVNNIRLAMRKINGYKLKSGEVFSFNDIVGKRDSENGFKMAAVIINGEYGEDMGGGVCQLSSTIFNAADKAGMEILERHSHSKEVKYVPVGRDAAVSYGYLDLKFKNTKEYDVELKAKIEDKKLKVYVYKVK
jgi:vancomycin resistance protein YoaR